MTLESLVKKLKEVPSGKKLMISYSDSDCDCCGYHNVTMLYQSKNTDQGEVFSMNFKDHHGDIFEIDESNVSCVQKAFFGNKKFMAKLKKISSQKKPKTATKHIGVEMEFVSKLDSAALQELLAENDLEDFVELKDDGSIDIEDDEYGHSHELCILATERTVGKVVKKVCSLLRRNSDVNSTCGLHVHMDMRNRDVEKAYKNLWAAQPLLYAMCPKTRLKNTFCKPAKDYNPGERDMQGDRYLGINRDAYKRHKTLEIRIHSSTLNATKINGWIKLLTRIADCNKVAEVPELWDSMEKFKKNVRMTKDLESYVNERISKFKGEHASSALPFAA